MRVCVTNAKIVRVFREGLAWGFMENDPSRDTNDIRNPAHKKKAMMKRKEMTRDTNMKSKAF